MISFKKLHCVYNQTKGTGLLGNNLVKNLKYEVFQNEVNNF